MKLDLNVGDWATIAVFALGTVLGCYAQAEHQRSHPSAASTVTANHGNSSRTAVVAVELE